MSVRPLAGPWTESGPAQRRRCSFVRSSCLSSPRDSPALTLTLLDDDLSWSPSGPLGFSRSCNSHRGDQLVRHCTANSAQSARSSARDQTHARARALPSCRSPTELVATQDFRMPAAPRVIPTRLERDLQARQIVPPLLLPRTTTGKRC